MRYWVTIKDADDLRLSMETITVGKPSKLTARQNLNCKFLHVEAPINHFLYKSELNMSEV